MRAAQFSKARMAVRGLGDDVNRNIEFMLYGLTTAWLIVVAYVLLLALREAKLRKELDRVRKMVEGESRKD